ncbi:hypothetical protein [Pseudomonas gozinkensis]|uniref:hypothetical protein n=1 Tax=Pseudomonas gozinkensis TaxID=2774461 RepID=UPI0017888623|nr:hypothetical protein [Pseudomonas gozinkensis]
MSTPIPTFKFCETLGGTPIPNPGSAPTAGFRIGGMGGPPGGPYVITNNSVPLITGKTYNASGEFIETILNPAPGSYRLELRANTSLPATDSWILTVTDVNKLPAPIPRERQDDPTDDPRFIDLALLGKNPLQVIVLTADNRFEAGDTVNATVTVKMPNVPDVVVPLSGTVATDQFGQKQPLVLQAANNLFSTGATVLIDYKLLRGTTPVGDSDTATAQVIGVPLPDLFAPRFQKSIAGKLDPLDPANLQGANAQAEVLDALPGDTAKMIVQGAPGVGSPTFTAIPFNTNKRANFALDSAFIAANMGKPITFFYQFFRNGNSYESEKLDGSVDRITDSDSALPVGRIDEIESPDLDLAKLLPTSQFRLAAWPHQQSGQTGWLKYTGIDKNGATVVYDDLKGEPLSSGPGLIRSAPVSWLNSLLAGSNLNLSFKLNFSDIPNYSEAVLFPQKNYRVIISGYEDWEQALPGTEFPTGSPVTLKSGLTVTTIRAATNGGVSGLYAAVGYPGLGKTTMNIHYNCSIRFSWEYGQSSSVELYHLYNSSSSNSVRFYDINGQPLSAVFIPVSNDGITLLRYNAPAGRFIGSFEWDAKNETDQGCWIKSIKWI